MSDVKDKPKPARVDRRPEQVPHHPKVLVAGAIVAAIALVLMAGWFWSLNTGQGLVLTAEQQRAAEIQAQEDLEADEAAEQDKTQADLDREAEAKEAAGSSGGSPGKGAPPAAPSSSDTVTPEVELTEYSILAVNGILNVGGRVKNVSAKPLSGTVRTYVYIDSVPVATATTEISGLAPGESTKVNMVSDSEYEPGEKVVLVEFEPRK